MKVDQLQVGTCYFGRTITGLRPYGPKPDLGVVDFVDENGDHNISGFHEFCSWVVVKQGGEPTDPWHALCIKAKEKGLSSRKRVVINGKAYRKRRGKLVEIPAEWVGRTVTPQTIRKRKSKKSQGRRFKRKVMR